MDGDEEGKKKAKAGSFQAMGLNIEIFKGINRMGYKVPTPVQRKALPIVLAGMDCVCMARTGSGKTCVFLLPMMEKLLAHKSNRGVRGLILSPTRELAKQTLKFAKDMAKFTDLRIISICGGDPIEAQFEELAARPDIIIATPGRLMHMLREIPSFQLKHIEYIAFDEADRLFEMGFAEQLNEIVRECPPERQTLLFSATMPAQLVQFSRAGLRDAQLIRLDTDTKMSDELRLAFLCVRSNEKVAALLYLVRRIIPRDQLTVIFTATKHHSEYIHTLFQRVGLKSTLVYGSMDQDARTLNLKMFRSGEVNYMIVTDLAARGIDVPLLDNVINFHFPASPKLFVHRCGRAARQGRIGFAFSIVEPDELSYAMDVHIFLSKSVDSGYPEAREGEDADGQQMSAAYTLNSMKPSMVHTGIFPQDVIAEEIDSLESRMEEDEELRMMWRVCENGMKQYRRTRSESSRSGIKEAKRIAKNDLIRTIHPLIAGTDPDRCSANVVKKASFIRHLQSFRPAQTVFESGIGTGVATAGSKTGKRKAMGDTYGVEIMRALRREVAPALERPRIAGAPEAKGEDSDSSDEEAQEGEGGEDSGDEVELASNDEYAEDDSEGEEDMCSGEKDRGEAISHPKVRMSRAMRKKLKKGEVMPQLDSHAALLQAGVVLAGDDYNGEDGGGGPSKKARGFIDKKYYMTYGNEDEVAAFVEDSMQPQSGLKSNESMNARMLETAMLDVAPDDAMEMNKKRKMMRWDAKKRKFVKQTLEEMTQSKSGVKKLRTEQGVIMSKSTKAQGEMYNTWKKKTHREISLPGAGDDDDRPRPNFKFNRNVPDELKNSHQIRKEQKEKSNMKLKNMKKDKRRSFEAKGRKNKSEAAQSMQHRGTKAGNRKVKAIFRK